MKKKKLANAILILPLLGALSVYIYVVLVMISAGTTAIFSIDPKNSAIGYLYSNFFLFLPFIGYLSIIPSVLIMLTDVIKYKGSFIFKPLKWLFAIGLILLIFTSFYDVGNYQNWFYD